MTSSKVKPLNSAGGFLTFRVRMKVCLYGELSPMLRGSGIGSAIDHQQRALELNGVEVTRKHRDRYDIIDINTIGPRSAYVAHKIRWKAVPVVMHTHTTVEDIRDSFKFSTKIAPKLKGYLRYFYAQADLLISPSQYTRDVIKSYGVKSDITVISNGVDTAVFGLNEEKRGEYREMYNLEKLVPFSVGHVFKRKGVLNFMEIAREFPQDRFMWVGRGYKSLVDEETKMAVKNKPQNVFFTGYVKDVSGAYCAGDIFMFPSWCENQGISILEAAACKRPIIVRDLPTYDGWLEDGVNCLKARDNREFIKHLKSLMDKHRLREKLAHNAYKMSQEHNLKRIGMALKQTYESLL